MLIYYSVPSWIEWCFLSVIFIPSIMIALLVSKTIHQLAFVKWKVLGFFLAYFSYITIGGYLGWFNQVFLPPLVLLFCTFPYALFLFTVVFNSRWYKQFLEQVTLPNLVRIHIFRLIGIFFILLALYQALPPFFAVIAGIGDITTAIASIFVAKALRLKKTYAKLLTMVWNIFGFADIAFTAVTAIILTKISIDTGAMGVDTLARFPFYFIPAFAPPTIVFLHIAIFSKLKKNVAN